MRVASHLSISGGVLQAERNLVVRDVDQPVPSDVWKRLWIPVDSVV